MKTSQTILCSLLLLRLFDRVNESIISNVCF